MKSKNQKLFIFAEEPAATCDATSEILANDHYQIVAGLQGPEVYNVGDPQIIKNPQILGDFSAEFGRRRGLKKPTALSLPDRCHITGGPIGQLDDKGIVFIVHHKNGGKIVEPVAHFGERALDFDLDLSPVVRELIGVGPGWAPKKHQYFNNKK